MKKLATIALFLLLLLLGSASALAGSNSSGSTGSIGLPPVDAEGRQVILVIVENPTDLPIIDFNLNIKDCANCTASEKINITRIEDQNGQLSDLSPNAEGQYQLMQDAIIGPKEEKSFSITYKTIEPVSASNLQYYIEYSGIVLDRHRADLQVTVKQVNGLWEVTNGGEFEETNYGAPHLFSDIGYEKSVAWLKDNGVIEGYSDGSFKPYNCVSRTELLKMLAITTKADISSYKNFPASQSKFTDLDETQWYWPYVQYAAAEGIVQGYPDGTFRPANCVNRAEAIKMTVEQFYPQGYFETNDGSASFAYKRDMVVGVDYTSWYAPYFLHAFNFDKLSYFTSEVLKIKNDPEGDYQLTYDIADSMPRIEVAEMLYRFRTIADNEIKYYSVSFQPDDLQPMIEVQNQTYGWNFTSERNITGDYVESAEVIADDQGNYQVQVNFNEAGARLFAELTAANIGNSVGIFLDDELISAPIVNAKITGGSTIIVGLFTEQEANDLAEKINGSRTSQKLMFVEKY